MATDKVMSFVEEELRKDPNVTNEKLFQGAKKISRAVARLTPRQFHAKYPLQVKRRRRGRTSRRQPGGIAARSAVRTRKAMNGDTEAVRKVMMRFAKDVAEADNQTQTIEVLSNLDGYVAEIMKAARP